MEPGVHDLAWYVEGLVEGREGDPVQRKRARWVWHVCRGMDGGTAFLRYYAKRGVGAEASAIRREAANARALAAAGIGARVLATGPFHGAEWLVTADAGDPWYESLDADDEERRFQLDALALFVRVFHELGWSYPDFERDHIRLDDHGIVLIDVARAARGSRPPRQAVRARDLASMLFGLCWPGVGTGSLSRHERVRLLCDATGWSRGSAAPFLRRVDAAVRRRVLRTRWRHGFDSFEPEFYDCLCDRVGEDWDLEGLLDTIREREGVTLLRRVPDRSNWRLDGDTGEARYFLKKFPATKRGWSPAMREVAAIDLFQRKGILVNRVAAYAEDVDKGSLVAVKACAGEPLDDLLRGGTVTVAERRALAVQTARIWRRMRECGLRHRDAYPCHLFAARTDQSLRFELRLIDLTRAGEAPWPRERWYVKDAAALWHGLPKPPVTRTDAVRWLREYFRVPKLTREAKRFARAVAAKERRIAARQERKRSVRGESGTGPDAANRDSMRRS